MYQHEPLDNIEIIINHTWTLELHILSLLSFPHHQLFFHILAEKERERKINDSNRKRFFRLFKHNSDVKSQVHLWNKFQTRKLQARSKMKLAILMGFVVLVVLCSAGNSIHFDLGMYVSTSLHIYPNE